MTISSSPGATDLIAAHARRVRRVVPDLAAEIVEAVSERVPRYARPAPTSRSALAEAATTALHRFLDALDGAPHRDRGIDELFRSLGRREARAGRTLVDFHAAMSVATRVGWARFQALGEDNTTPAIVSDGLFAFVDHLARQTEAGHAEASRVRAADPNRARAALAEQLLTGADVSDRESVWEVPATVVLAIAELGGERPDLGELARSALMVGHDDTVVVIADAADRDCVTTALVDAGVSRVALGWAVHRSAIPSAFRWARRALDLVRRGVIPDTPVVDCRAHRTQIWLHAEPTLRQQLGQELLSPLLAETPNSREILSETLLVWLETRDSAPAIAAKLGVHPQTIRYRWKRINELFGEDLHDPEFIVQITMLLKASVPLWKAGDQSDFELFRAEEPR
ncbi:MAG: helix-turn-helix domain-containing protein [Aeromicrobium erythreum]